MNPICKFICLLLFTFCTLFSTWYLLAFLFLFVLWSMLFSKISLSTYFKMLYVLRLLFLLLVLVFLFMQVPFILICLYLVRIVILCLSVFVFTLTTPITEMTYTYEIFLFPLSKIHLSPSKIAIKLALYSQFIPSFINKKKELLYTVSSLGIDYNHSSRKGKLFVFKSIIGPLFSLSRKECHRVEESMKLRNFEIGKVRTNYQMNTWHILDIVFIIIHGIMIVLTVSEVFL
ncbi:MAG: energy-coupling factor transporter transmembrane component T [Bacilli bacterium]|nr:energy-coupling factor transporter transmembrane component T [Bacilli bacterium]